MRIIFFGTPLFAAKVLDDLLRRQVEVVAVISRPDRPKGRSGTPVSTPVKAAALSFNSSIPVHQPEAVSSPEFAEVLQSYQADLFVVVAYGEILKQHVLDIPRIACINVHASLLPRYRGAAPIQKAIIEGESETGVTIMHMVRKMDAGDMIEKVIVPISPEMTFGELEDLLCEAGKETLLHVIRAFESGEPDRKHQEHSLATYAPKIELEDCEISWSRPAQEIHNLVRGVNPYPGAWCMIDVKGEKKRLKISRTRIVSSENALPGTILNASDTKGNLIVSTGNQAIELLEVQLEGKKRMSSEELARGIPRSWMHFL